MALKLYKSCRGVDAMYAFEVKGDRGSVYKAYDVVYSHIRKQGNFDNRCEDASDEYILGMTMTDISGDDKVSVFVLTCNADDIDTIFEIRDDVLKNCNVSFKRSKLVYGVSIGNGIAKMVTHNVSESGLKTVETCICRL